MSGLIETWDVLKPPIAVRNSDGVIWLIETWDVLKQGRMAELQITQKD